MERTIEQRIGWRIHKLREGKRMTLARLAEKTGLSKGLLSKIENGRVSSPVSTLSLIADSLKVKLSYLLDDDGDQPRAKYVLVRRWERTRLDRGTERFGFYYEMIAHQKPDKKMEPSVLNVENRRKAPVMFTHPGEELIFVLEGRMEFSYGAEKFQMEAGDSIYFEASVPHGGRNLDDTPLRVLMVICEQ
ncbi:MAG: XRE family transcriptional regulator [Thermodesulfobacteriota bacterium]